jgi:hypothetical protein
VNSLYYLAMLIGIGWLAVWSILPPEQHGRGWWPFDMRSDAPAAGKQQRQQGQRQEPETATTPQSTGPSPGPRQPLSWRNRRESRRHRPT